MVPLVGEPLALDLVNTLANTPDGQLDLVRTPDMFRAWTTAQVRRLEPPQGDVDLNQLRTLRRHVAEAIERARAGLAPPAAALRALTEAQRAAPPYRQLGWDGTVVTTTRRRDGEATGKLLAELAESAVDLLASPSIGKVRRCQGPGCRMLFVPAHPHRRWCSPALCGNRVRVARYYQRHRR